MQQLALSDHSLYCVVRAAQLLHHSRPNLPRIHLVLRNACFARSDVAVYFSIMLKVLVSEGFDRDRILSDFFDFFDFFVRQCLAYCRDLISAGDFLFNWERLELRLIPLAWLTSLLVPPKKFVH